MPKSELFERIVNFLQQYKIKRIAVFGSFARDAETTESDIDLIVEFQERKSLLDLVTIEIALSEAIGIRTDLLTEKSISPYIIDAIKSEMKVIFP
ncbi:MAG: nucleotidyltransferase family protein [Candidatus Heimdallarchaeota archaeon]